MESQNQSDEEMEDIEMEDVLNVVKKMIDNCEAFMVQNCSETLKVVIKDDEKKINNVNWCN